MPCDVAGAPDEDVEGPVEVAETLGAVAAVPAAVDSFDVVLIEADGAGGFLSGSKPVTGGAFSVSLILRPSCVAESDPWANLEGTLVKEELLF